jgi:hypothetical protein
MEGVTTLMVIVWHKIKMDYALAVVQVLFQPKEDVSTMMPIVWTMILIHLVVVMPFNHFHSVEVSVFNSNLAILILLCRLQQLVKK